MPAMMHFITLCTLLAPYCTTLRQLRGIQRHAIIRPLPGAE